MTINQSLIVRYAEVFTLIQNLNQFIGKLSAAYLVLNNYTEYFHNNKRLRLGDCLLNQRYA